MGLLTGKTAIVGVGETTYYRRRQADDLFPGHRGDQARRHGRRPRAHRHRRHDELPGQRLPQLERHGASAGDAPELQPRHHGRRIEHRGPCRPRRRPARRRLLQRDGDLPLDARTHRTPPRRPGTHRPRAAHDRRRPRREPVHRRHHAGPDVRPRRHALHARLRHDDPPARRGRHDPPLPRHHESQGLLLQAAADDG